MRRSAGAILRDRRPATIIKADCRGLPRNTSAPKRAMSYREQLIAIISIAQQARPKVTGQIDDRRAHCTIFSTVVVSTGMSASRPIKRSSKGRKGRKAGRQKGRKEKGRKADATSGV